MKQIKKKLLAITLMLCIAVSSLCVLTAEAKSSEFSMEDVTFPVAKHQSVVHTVEIIGAKKANQVQNLKVSNSAVASIELESDPGQNYMSFHITPKKVGTTNVSFTLKKGKKKKNYSFKVKIIKYINPAESIIVGPKDFTAPFNDSMHVSIVKPARKVKISIKPKKGWKLTSLIKRNRKAGGKYVKMKNNTTIDTNKVDYIAATFKKGSRIQSVSFNFMDPPT